MILPSPERRTGTMSARVRARGGRAGGRGQCCTPCAARPVAGSGTSVPGEPEPEPSPAGQRRGPRAPSRRPTCQRALPPRTAPKAPRAPAPPAASQWETCCQAESSFEWPNQVSQPQPLLIWGPGDAIANPPPRHRRLPRLLPLRSTAHPLPEAPPTPSAARRAREKRPALGGRGEKGRGGRSPAAGSASSGGRAGSWSGKFQAGGRVSPALPSHTAPQRRFSPPPDSSWRASPPIRAAPRACCGQRARLPSPSRTLPVGAAAPRSGAFGWPRRGRAAPCGNPRCAPAAGRPRLSVHCSSGPSLSPPSSASRPSLLPPQVPPSLVTGAV